MFMTGTKPGKIKIYYTMAPYKIVARFPYISLPARVRNIFSKLGILDLVKELYNKFGNTEEARTLFVKKCQEQIYRREVI